MYKNIFMSFIILQAHKVPKDRLLLEDNIKLAFRESEHRLILLVCSRLDPASDDYHG